MGKIQVLITRQLDEDSPFFSTLAKLPVQVHGEALVEFRRIPFSVHFKTIDWVFFTSPTGVDFFFEGLKESKSGIPPQVLVGAIGTGTEKRLKSYGRSPDFSGNGSPARVGSAFAALAKGQRVLFPRARTSRRSIQQFVEERAQIEEQVIYDNHIRRDLKLPLFDFLVFTSPLNARAFYSTYPVTPHQKVFAIGETTAKALYDLGVQGVIVAPYPSEAALAEMVGRELPS